MNGIAIGNIAIDCDEPASLQDFYAGLLDAYRPRYSMALSKQHGRICLVEARC